MTETFQNSEKAFIEKHRAELVVTKNKIDSLSKENLQLEQELNEKKLEIQDLENKFTIMEEKLTKDNEKSLKEIHY